MQSTSHLNKQVAEYFTDLIHKNCTWKATLQMNNNKL